MDDRHPCWKCNGTGEVMWKRPKAPRPPPPQPHAELDSAGAGAVTAAAPDASGAVAPSEPPTLPPSTDRDAPAPRRMVDCPVCRGKCVVERVSKARRVGDESKFWDFIGPPSANDASVEIEPGQDLCLLAGHWRIIQVSCRWCR